MKWSEFAKWVSALLLIIPILGCAEFLEDYSYNPVGSQLSSTP